MDELKRCPFCGGKSETDKYAPSMAYCIDGLSGADNDDKKCYSDAILSVDDWNTRPIEDELAAEITKLEHIIDDREAEISRLTSDLTNGRELLAMALAEGERLNAEIESLRVQLEIEKDYE